MQHFEQATAPWVDRDDFAAEAERRHAAGELDDEALGQLESWRRDGYLALPGAVEPALVDALLADYEAAWAERPALECLVEDLGVKDLAEVASREDLGHHHFRVTAAGRRWCRLER